MDQPLARACGLCGQQLQQPQPAEDALPCGHAVCAACLREQGREHGDGGRRCPSCSKIFKAGPAEVDPRPQTAGNGAPETSLRRAALVLRSLAVEAAAEALRLEAAASQPTAARQSRGGDDAEAAAESATALLVRPELLYQLQCALGALRGAEALSCLPADGKPAVSFPAATTAGRGGTAETADAASQTEEEEASESRPAASRAPVQGDAATPECGRSPASLQKHPASGASLVPSRPCEAPAAVGHLPADADVAAAEPHGPSATLDALPDELLELILSLVPTKGRYGAAALLRLRRVSRRWARLLCSAEVWRHQTLQISPPAHRALRDPCIPALDAVDVWLGRGTRDVESVLRALATTSCKIRCLSLMTNVTSTAAKWVPRILQQHRHRLQELNLNLSPKNDKSDQLHYADPIFAAVATMSRLRALSLEIPYPRPSLPVRLVEYDFSRVRGLQRLTLGGRGVGASTLASLVRANKDTLLEVDCGYYDVFDLLPQCPLLRRVTTSAIEHPSSRRLAEVAGLRALAVKRTCLKGIRGLVRLLDGSEAVPAELHLDGGGFEPQYTLLQAAASLGSRLRSLRLSDYLFLSEAQFVAALGELPRLELLVFTETQATDWARVVAAWTERTAPRLRELHVHWPGPCDSARSPLWVPRLQAARRALRICTNNDCWARCW